MDKIDPKIDCLGTKLGVLKVEGLNWASGDSLRTKMAISPKFIIPWSGEEKNPHTIFHFSFFFFKKSHAIPMFKSQNYEIECPTKLKN